MVPIIELNDGTKIPQLGYGTWQLEKQACIEGIKAALEIGYRHIDTAQAYYNHKEVGEGIKGFDREKLFITTKLWRDFFAKKDIESSVDTSLKDLGIDYIDLILVHWPLKEQMLEIVGELHRLKQKGKVRSVGVSNCTERHIQDLIDGGLSPSMNQVEFHPYFNQKKLLAFCKEKKIHMTAYSPIARGLVLKDPLIKEMGKTHTKTAPQITLRWLIQKGLVVIPKASDPEHAKQNFNIFDFKLSEREMEKMETLHRNERQINPDFQEFDYQ